MSLVVDGVGAEAAGAGPDLYGADYIAWKNWDESAFAAMSRAEARYFAAELRRLNRRLDRNASILEIGFGKGAFLRFAQDQGWNVSGTEANPTLVDLARKRGFNAVHATELSCFPDKAFDLVAAFDVFEHIPPDRLLAFVGDIKRVLKPGGALLARFPNGDSPFALAYQNGDPTHMSFIGSFRVRHLAHVHTLLPVYVGAQAQPILTGSAIGAIHTLLTRPIKTALNALVSVIFFPRAGISFFSANLVAVLARPNE